MVELVSAVGNVFSAATRRQLLEGKVTILREQANMVCLAAGMLRHLRGYKYRVCGKQQFVTKEEAMDALESMFGRLSAPVEEYCE